jgi:hypothetical protein
MMPDRTGPDRPPLSLAHLILALLAPSVLVLAPKDASRPARTIALVVRSAPERIAAMATTG